MKPTLCFGEVMARLSPPGKLRLRQAMPGTLEVTFAGAEVNVAASIAALGGAAEFVTALPRNEIADACLAALRAADIGVRHVGRPDRGRFGLYFFEPGANQRVGNVVYDREYSTFALTPAGEYEWAKIFAGAGWFHTTGISPGVSRVAAEATLAAARAARAAGLTVSCDLNFRRKLWRWNASLAPEELARQTLAELMPSVDLAAGGAADLALVAGLDWSPEPGAAGDAAALTALAQDYVRRFPLTKWVAMTLREGQSASHSRWGAFLYQAADGKSWLAPTTTAAVYAPFDITAIVDPLGAGDAFVGALVFALQTPELAEPARALHFATAASCLAHSISGDFNFCSRQDVEALMAGSNGSRVGR